ncbi:uncharacterized protein EV420DRAFT_1635142 [Desarmillaria tabescens]|uniref:Uncharacterized protein n=1 Tax=Armillaria tabescens TaxID=1929756 RepID=A0AA39NLJ5_ARMTA|nr:uncharacterized protein EV420DRAFT_1635142 [Desarmillaria tabescens]KAK0467875.1 hypothetical protein EV420DRAFT_1635142 [Desarmillaria tabescens]
MEHSSLPTSDAALHKLEKQIQKEGKLEDSSVKHSLKDLASAEKGVKKADKGLDKTGKILAKREKEELSAVKALNKATHEHNIAVAKSSDAQKNLKLQQSHDTKLHQDLETKKAQVESAINAQKTHNEVREAKIAEIQAVGTGGRKPSE